MKNFFLLTIFITTILSGKTYTIYVNSLTTDEMAYKRWNPTVEFLNEKMPHHSFKLLPIKPTDVEKIKNLLNDKKIDFLLTQPAIFSELKYTNGVNRVLTMTNNFGMNKFGSVLITHKDNSIENILDIKGKTVAAAAPLGFGGWLVAYSEMFDRGVDPLKDNKVTFTGSQTKIVDFILDKKYEVGVIKTGMLEYLSTNHNLDISNIKIINEIPSEYPVKMSTQLYAEWTFAIAKHINDDQLQNDIFKAMNSITKDSKAAVAGKYQSWGLPQNYNNVDEILKKFQLAHYKDMKNYSSEDIVKITLSILLLSIFVLLYIKYKMSLQIQKELKLNQNYLQGILDVIPNIMIITDGKNITKANPAMLKFTGFNTIEEFKQKHKCICEFYIKDGVCLMPVIEGFNWLEYVLSEPTKIHEVSMMKEGKKYRFIVQEKLLVLDNLHHAVVIFTDVTEIEGVKKQLNSSNKILLENEGKLRAITDSSLDAIIMLDNQGRFIFSNPKAKEILGYDASELMGKDFHKIAAPKSFHEAAKKAYEKFARTGEGAVLGQVLELSAIRKGGQEFPISLVLSGVQIDGKWHGIGFMRDITEKKELESELKQKDKIMLSQSRQAAMGDMISMIAHQWRQPITAIGMSAQNLQLDIELEDIDLKRFDTKLTTIVEQTEFLSKTIDDFRDFFKPNKKPNTNMLSNTVEGALSVVGKSLENNNIRLEKYFENDIQITTYHNELIQVLINIINNAKDIINIKEKDDGLITIQIYSDKDNAYIKVCDNAGGIPDSALSRIFEPYFTTKEGKGGTGLGLYMSKMLVEKHLKGEIIAENINGGACFTLSFSLNNKKGVSND